MKVSLFVLFTFLLISSCNKKDESHDIKKIDEKKASVSTSKVDNFDDLKEKEKDSGCSDEESDSKEFKLQGGDSGCDKSSDS